MLTSHLKHCDYTCNSCNHTWDDTKERGFEDSAYKYGGCPECNSKDCSWEAHVNTPMTEEELAAVNAKMSRPGSKLGKPPKEFVEQVLGRIHDHHKGIKGETTINRDW